MSGKHNALLSAAAAGWAVLDEMAPHNPDHPLFLAWVVGSLAAVAVFFGLLAVIEKGEP